MKRVVTGKGEDGRIGEWWYYLGARLFTESLAAYWLRSQPTKSRLVAVGFSCLHLDVDA